MGYGERDGAPVSAAEGYGRGDCRARDSRAARGVAGADRPQSGHARRRCGWGVAPHDAGDDPRGLAAGLVEQDLAFAIEQLERVKRLVQGLLGLSRQTNDFEEVLSLERVAVDAARVVSAQVKDAVRIDVAPPAGLPETRGNYA